MYDISREARALRALAPPLRLLATLAATAWLLLASASAALACPDCAVGRAARSDVFSNDFALHLGIMLAPFAVMVAVSAWVERLGRVRGTPGGDHEE